MGDVFLSNIIRKYIKGKSPDNNEFLLSKNYEEVSYLTPEYLRDKGLPIKVKNQKSFVWVEEGDVIILWDGSNAGEILKGKNGVLPSTMVKLNISDDYYKGYVFYLLKFNEYKFKGKTQGSGIPHANKDEIERVKVYKIGFLEQSKIAEILTTIDNSIKKTERIIAKYKRIKQGLMQDLLTKGIDENGNIRSEATHKFKDSPLGKIPVEWEMKPLSSWVSKDPYAIVDGPFGSNLKTEHYRESGHPVIQSGYVTSGEFIADSYYYVDNKKFMEQRRSKAVPGDIIMAKIGAQCGRCAILPNRHPISIIAGNCLKITVSKNNNTEFLLKYLQYLYALGKLDNIKATTAQPAINLSKLKKFEVPMPEKSEQDRIVNVIFKIEKYISKEKSFLEKLFSIKQGLMRDLLTGKVRVTHLLDKGGESGECHS